MRISYKFLSIVIILLLGIVVYSNSFGGPLVFDDIAYIKSNTGIRDLAAPQEMWNMFSHPSRFVGLYTFSLNYHFHRYEVFGYHLVNFLIHAFNALLVFWLTRLLFRTKRCQGIYRPNQQEWISFLTAALFVAHPLQTQAVTYIVQRFASLATLFYLFSVCSYIKARLTQRNSWLFYLLSALSALLGMFTKQIVITLPVMILLMEYLFIQPLSKDDWNFKKLNGGLLVVLFLFFLIIPSFFNFDVGLLLEWGKAKGSGSHRGDPIHFPYYIYTQFSVITTYLRLLFFPIGQNLLYDFRSSLSLFEVRTLSSLLVLGSIILYAFRLFPRRPLAALGIFWFFLTLSVESSIIPIWHVIFEHRVYLPSFGFCLFFTTMMVPLIMHPIKRMVVFGVILLTLGYLTYQRNIVWQDDVSLWADNVQKAPEKSRPVMNLGLSLMQRGEYQEAVVYFSEAIKNNPQNKGAYSNRATANFVLGKYQETLADFNQALDIDSNYVEGLINRGNLYGKMKKFDLAIADYTKAIEINPKSAEAYINRGNKYARLKKIDLALKDFNKAIEVSPQFYQGYRNRGNLYEKLSQWDLALQDYDQAIRIERSSADLYLKRGGMYEKKGVWQKALDDYNKSLKLSPDNIPVLSRRGKIYFELKQYNRALRDLLRLQELGVNVSDKQINGIKSLILKNL